MATARFASRVLRNSVVIAFAAVFTVTFVPSASAAGPGNCPYHRVCFFFNSNHQGARADYAYSDATMGNELFTDGPVGASGWGVQVNNNAASVANWTDQTLYLYDQPGCEGPRKAVGSFAAFNLGIVGLKNKVSSISFNEACRDRDQSWA